MSMMHLFSQEFASFSFGAYAGIAIVQAMYVHWDLRVRVCALSSEMMVTTNCSFRDKDVHVSTWVGEKLFQNNGTPVSQLQQVMQS